MKVKVIDGDVRDPQVVEAACESVDVIFHQAAIRIMQCAAEPRLATEVLDVLSNDDIAERHDP